MRKPLVTIFTLIATTLISLQAKADFTCTDIESDSNYVITGKTLAGIPHLTLSKLESYNGPVEAEATYGWSAGSSLSDPSSPLTEYTGYFDFYPTEPSVLPNEFRIDYEAVEPAPPFPKVLMLLISEGSVYHVYKMNCHQDVTPTTPAPVAQPLAELTSPTHDICSHESCPLRLCGHCGQ